VNDAVKNILRAALNLYAANPERNEKQIAFTEKQLQEFSSHRLADAWAYKNKIDAAKLFLRIVKPSPIMEKHNKKVDHSQRAHALLSASGASRWITCSPSARLEESFENKSSSFAEEGTLAHEFAELNLRVLTELISEKEYKKALEPLLAHKLYGGPEMELFIEKHTDYVLEQFTEAKRLTPDAVLSIETKVDITHLIEEGFGTCDVIIIADGVLEVIDLKYGMGVRVEAEENKQLMLYGSGALEAYAMLYDIHTVRLTITQPRLDSISSWEISADDLRKWGEEVVKPAAIKAYAGKGEQVTGDHCKFCRASARCKAQADLALSTAQEDFKDPQLLTDDELVDIYAKVPSIDSWLKKVSAYMYEEALEGKKWSGYKLVDGQNRRAWSDEEEARRILKIDYVDEWILTEPKLKGITEIEKLVGKKEFNALLGDVVMHKKTSPSLVPESDKRPERLSAEDRAIKAFDDDL
jgi:Protein of unknown function (DUF2800)